MATSRLAVKRATLRQTPHNPGGTAVISILDPWVPIALASVLVFIVSSLLHMVFTYHRADYKALPREADIMAALRSADLAPGLYMFLSRPVARTVALPP